MAFSEPHGDAIAAAKPPITHAELLVVRSIFGLTGVAVHDALVSEYLLHELVGHISRDSTAIIGREKTAKKAGKEPKSPRRQIIPALQGALSAMG